MSYYQTRAQEILEYEAHHWAEYLEASEEPYQDLAKVLAMRIFELEEQISKLRNFKNVGCTKY